MKSGGDFTASMLLFIGIRDRAGKLLGLGWNLENLSKGHGARRGVRPLKRESGGNFCSNLQRAAGCNRLARCETAAFRGVTQIPCVWKQGCGQHAGHARRRKFLPLRSGVTAFLIEVSSRLQGLTLFRSVEACRVFLA